MPKDRRILVQQHCEMRPVLVELNTTFQNLMNYFSHPRGNFLICMPLSIINTSKLYPFWQDPYTRQLLSKSNQETPKHLTCDLYGIVLSKLNTPMTHPGPTTFGEDRHQSIWEDYGNKQATNKQALLELEYYEKLFKLFALFYILMRIHIYDFDMQKLFFILVF